MASEISPRTTFRLASKTFFLTFPQCNFPLSEFVSKIQNFFQQKNRIIEKGVASQEQHQDGHLHLHAFIVINKQISTCNPAYFDNLVDPPKHPNIVSHLRGSHHQTIQYVIKDGTYQSFPPEFDLQAFLQLHQPKEKPPRATKEQKIPMTKQVAARIEQGATLAQIDDEFPHYVMTHLAPLQRYLEYRETRHLQHQRAQAHTMTFHVKPADGHSSYSNIQLATWLNSMIFNRSIPHRPTQMWVKTSPGAGKSSLINQLEDEFGVSVYRWPLEEQWFDGYTDGAYDLIVLDEYKAQKKITQLNPILSGDRVPLSRRGLPPYVKRDILPVLILSNYTPSEAYHKSLPAALESLESRIKLIVYHPGEHIRLVSDLPIEEIPTPTPPSSPPQSISQSSTPDLTPTFYHNRTMIENEHDIHYDDPNDPSFFTRSYLADAARRIRASAKREARPPESDSSTDEMPPPRSKKLRPPRSYPKIKSFFEEEAECSEQSCDDSFESDEDPTLGGFIVSSDNEE